MIFILYVVSMDTRQQKNKAVSSDEWYTPKWLIDKLGPFDLDPCAPEYPPYQIAPLSYNRHQNGLSREWPCEAVVWLNPPYSRVLLHQFCERMANHNNGIAILVNRQDNLLWQQVIFSTAKSMIFMRHRVKFLRPDGSTGNAFFGSCLVAWGCECDRRLRECDIEGKYVKLND